MKTNLVTIAILFFSLAGYSQNAKVQTAWNYLKYEKLEQAAEAIDAASVHKQTIGKDKTWYYRGLVYHKIHEDSALRVKFPDCLKTAYNSFAKALEVDPESSFKKDIQMRMPAVLNRMFQEGVDHYNNKNFEAALGSFEQVLELNEMDTLAIVNAGFSADRAGNTAKAKSYLTRLVEMKYSDAKVYLFLSKIHKTEGDSSGGLAIIQQARAMFPDDNNLVIEELNYFLAAGQHQEALVPLNAAIEKDISNPSLFFARGNIYDKIGDTDKAKSDYLKAIELKADYFDAYYNLGAMFFNQGADMFNKANNIPPTKQKAYEAARKEADEKFMEAMPYLEKAFELNPEDLSTLVSLKQLYVRVGETVKYEKIKALLEEKSQ